MSRAHSHTHLPAESPRPGPPSRPWRRPGRTAATSVVALLAVGGAACSSASAPPSAAPWTAGVGPSGTIPTPEMAALRAVANAVVVPTTTPPKLGASRSVRPANRPSLVSSSVGSAESATAVAALPHYPSGNTWWCSYFAVGAASGSTMELRIDDVHGRITPAAGDVVSLQCLEGSVLAYHELFVFDPERPFGSLDDILGPGVE